MQTKLAAVGLIAAASGGTWLAIAPPPGEYYAMSQPEVASRLVTAHMPGEMSDSMSQAGDLAKRIYKRGDSEVVWEFSVARTPLATFTAALEPDGEGTRVSVDFEISDSDVGKAIDQDIGEGREFLTGVLELAMEEHIAATLQKRKFDDDRFGDELGKYALSHPVAAGKFMRRVQAMNKTGSPSITEEQVRQKIETDAAWHSEVERTDTRGFDPSGSDPVPGSDGW